MRIWWCQEHEAMSVFTTSECSTATYSPTLLTNCRMVPMRLIPDNGEETDLLMGAWGVIANVSGGDWTQQSTDWQEAAAVWRANFHMSLALDGETP